MQANLIFKRPHIPRLEEDNVRQGFIEDEHYRLVLLELPGHLKAMFVCGYHLGMRAGEFRKLRWEQIDLGSKEVRLERKQTKSKRPRTAPIYGDMIPWLEHQKEEHDELWPDCPFVFHYRGRPISEHIKGWRRAAVAAGLPNLLFHDLRRSAVRNMERDGIPRKVAMSITGHRTESVYTRYDIVSGRDQRLAAEKLEAYFAKQKELRGASDSTLASTNEYRTREAHSKDTQ